MEAIMKLLNLFRTEQEPEVVCDEKGKVIAIRITIPISQPEESDANIDLNSAV